MKHFVGSVVCGRAAKEFFKKLIIVAGTVETDSEGQIRNGTEILFGIHQLSGRLIDPIRAKLSPCIIKWVWKRKEKGRTSKAVSVIPSVQEQQLSAG